MVIFHSYVVIEQFAIENGHRNSGFSHEKWWFSIAMLVYQRVLGKLWEIYGNLGNMDTVPIRTPLNIHQTFTR